MPPTSRKPRQAAGVWNVLNGPAWPSGFAPEVETAWADTVKGTPSMNMAAKPGFQGVPAARVFARARRCSPAGKKPCDLPRRRAGGSWRRC